MASMSCPSKPIEELISPVLKVLTDNKEYTILDCIEKGGMTLRSGRVLPEPSAKRVKMGGKRSMSRSRGKRSRGKRSRGKRISGVLTKNLEPKCAETFKISGYDTGIGFTRGLSNAMRLITGADSCGAIDEQHNIATVRFEIIIMQLVSMSAFITSLSYQQVKNFWRIILNACLSASSKSLDVAGSSASSFGSYVKGFFKSKEKVEPSITPDFNSVFTHDVVDEITKEQAKDGVDAAVGKALEAAAKFLEENREKLSPDIAKEASEELTVLNQEASREASPGPINASPSPSRRELETPDLEDLQPNSAPPTRESSLDTPMQGGKKHRRTLKYRKSKRSNSHKRRKAKKTRRVK